MHLNIYFNKYFLNVTILDISDTAVQKPSPRPPGAYILLRKTNQINGWMDAFKEQWEFTSKVNQG